MSNFLNIACLQTQPKSSIREALSEALIFAQGAVKGGAEFLFLPEYCAGLISENGKLNPPCSRENEHEFLLEMQSFAKENKVWIMIGSIAVSADNGKIFNRGFVLDSFGEIISRYDKIHMFDIQMFDNEMFDNLKFEKQIFENQMFENQVFENQIQLIRLLIPL